MDKIYIQKKGKVITGPYAVEQLQRHQLDATDKVWYEGLSEWTRPQSVDFLRRYISNHQRNGFLSRFLGASK
jgi:hypothetical protein